MADDKQRAVELYKRALGHFGKGEHETAVALYDEALELRIDWIEAMHGKAMALLKGGRIDDAIAVGRRIVELDPEDPFAHTSLSIFYQRKGLIEEAEKEAAKARMLSWKQELKTNPNAPPPATPSGPGNMNVMQ